MTSQSLCVLRDKVEMIITEDLWSLLSELITGRLIRHCCRLLDITVDLEPDIAHW